MLHQALAQAGLADAIRASDQAFGGQTRQARAPARLGIVGPAMEGRAALCAAARTRRSGVGNHDRASVARSRDTLEIDPPQGLAEAVRQMPGGGLP